MIITDFPIYDGSILQDRFAYEYFKEKTQRIGNIIAGRSAAKVEEDFMVDKQDLMDGDYIYADDMLHFLIEIPDVSLFAGVCFQRLFNSSVGNILASNYLHCDIEVDGDDINVIKEHMQGGVLLTRGKASVSITKECNGGVLIHKGINVVAGKKAPAFAYSTKLTDEQCNQFMNECCSMFYGMIQDVFVATSKIVK